MKKLFCFLTTISLLLILVLPLSAAGVQEEENIVKIGAIYPITGPLSVEGMQLYQALKVCQDLVNKSYDIDSPGDILRSEGLPNLGGAKIEMIFADSEGKPDVSRSEAERLITIKKVDALMGCWQSAATETASAVAEKHGVPYLNADSSSVTLTERGFKMFFRTTNTNATETGYMTDFLVDLLDKRPDLKIETVAVVCEDSLWGQDFGAYFTKWATEKGFDVVLNVSYPHEATDVDAEVLRIKRVDPDLIFMGPYLPDAVLFQKTYKKYDVTTPVLGATGHIRYDFRDACGSAVNGLMAMDLWSNSLIETNKMAGIFTELMRERYGEGAPFGNLPSRGYIGLITLVDAINRAGSTDPEAIRKALVNTNIPGKLLPLPWKGIKFDEKGQNIYGGLVIIQWQDEELEVIWPWADATAEVMLPLPPWDER